MLGYYADNRRFGRFGFQTEERSLAMKRRDTVYKALCGVWMAALVVPTLVFACLTGGNNWDEPSATAGPPVPGNFHWEWEVGNSHSSTIGATADPENCRYRREVPNWFDETVYSKNPAPTTNNYIPAYTWWRGADFGYTGSVMVYPNKYHWDWESWQVNSTPGDNNYTVSGGTGHTYNCNEP
jgi:hypothetical protein